MIQDYVEEYDSLPKSPLVPSFATVGGVYEGGLTLIFPGESKASTKRYLCNTGVKFLPGDRVFIVKDSGTFVVICPIGTPK